jgi:hypothetical protein
MHKIKSPLIIHTLASIIMLSIAIPGITFSQDLASPVDMYSGHYSREGNNGSPSAAINHSTYIKLFEDQWIVTLYIPLPYSASVDSTAITKVLDQAKKQTTTSAYLRGKFGQLTELATVQVEKFGYLEDRIVFECGSLAPCTITLGDGFLELIKPGMLNEHIIRYTHVVDA